MALSNWDTLAIDLDGAGTGSVTNHEGLAIEIYKNWLYLVDDTDGRKVVAQILEGQLSWGAWTIDARRGPQSGVFVVATSYRFLPAEEIDGDPEKVDRYTERRMLVGCGVSGYENELEKYADEIRAAGYDPEDEDTNFILGSNWDNDNDEARAQLQIRFLDVVEDGRFKRVLDNIDEPRWVGVEPRSVEFLKAMVAEQTTPSKYWDPTKAWPGNALAEINWDEVTRFNQGDMFFAAHTGSGLGATPPGEAQEPMLTQMLRPTDD